MALLDDVKAACRVTSTDTGIVGEVTDLIAAAEADLQLSGITVDETDALTKRAIVVYCKGHFGYNNPDADRFQQAYLLIKAALRLSGDHVV